MLSWILVQMDMELSLLEEIEIITEEKSFHQTLDFWHGLFHCHACRQGGHLKVNFPSLVNNFEVPKCMDVQTQGSKAFPQRGSEGTCITDPLDRVDNP